MPKEPRKCPRDCKDRTGGFRARAKVKREGVDALRLKKRAGRRDSPPQVCERHRTNVTPRIFAVRR